LIAANGWSAGDAAARLVGGGLRFKISDGTELPFADPVEPGEIAE
jgi:hypothetical protein